MNMSEQMNTEVDNKNKLLYKILFNYFERGLTQQEIAVKYGISRIRVSRMISKALAEKIVQIKINAPADPGTETEHLLEELYGLKEAVVIDHTSGNLLDDLGEAVAGYLSLRIQGHETIGITWGRSILAAANALGDTEYPDIKIIQMLGGLGNPDSDTHGTELAIRIARQFNGKARLLNSPGILKSKLLRDALMEDLQVSDTLKLASKSDIALVGIGSLKSDALIVSQASIINHDETGRLLKKGAIGDVGLRFFDRNGLFIEDEINERVIGLTPEEIKKIPVVVGVAGGAGKHLQVLAALKGKWINVLITDHITAQYLIHASSQTS
jgi:DNA-binding transcriptional regulator LsrR (DeoR family)